MKHHFKISIYIIFSSYINHYFHQAQSKCIYKPDIKIPANTCRILLPSGHLQGNHERLRRTSIYELEETPRFLQVFLCRGLHSCRLCLHFTRALVPEVSREDSASSTLVQCSVKPSNVVPYLRWRSLQLHPIGNLKSFKVLCHCDLSGCW